MAWWSSRSSVPQLWLHLHHPAPPNTGTSLPVCPWSIQTYLNQLEINSVHVKRKRASHRLHCPSNFAKRKQKKVTAWSNFAGTIGSQLRLAGESQAPDPRPLVINGPWPLPTPCRKATCHVPSPTHAPQKVTRPLLLPCTKQSQPRGRARREILPPKSHPGAPNFFLPARPRQPPHHLPFLAIAASRTVEHSFRISYALQRYHSEFPPRLCLDVVVRLAAT